jgi:hypothetical protein
MGKWSFPSRRSDPRNLVVSPIHTEVAASLSGSWVIFADRSSAACHFSEIHDHRPFTGFTNPDSTKRHKTRVGEALLDLRHIRALAYTCTITYRE